MSIIKSNIHLFFHLFIFLRDFHQQSILSRWNVYKIRTRRCRQWRWRQDRVYAQSTDAMVNWPDQVSTRFEDIASRLLHCDLTSVNKFSLDCSNIRDLSGSYPGFLLQWFLNPEHHACVEFAESIYTSKTPEVRILSIMFMMYNMESSLFFFNFLKCFFHFKRYWCIKFSLIFKLIFSIWFKFGWPTKKILLQNYLNHH